MRLPLPRPARRLLRRALGRPRPFRRGPARYFDAMVVMTRLRRGKPMAEADKNDLTGWNGAVNMVFSGRGGGAWHMTLSPEEVWVRRGERADARATVKTSVETFADLVMGRTSFMVASMSGRVRVEGDGHATMLFGGLVRQLGELRAAEGTKGRIGTWMTRGMEARA